MAITTRNTLRDWFASKAKPTAGQFSSLFDSFWHKSDDSIGINDISGLSSALGGKVSTSQLTALSNAVGALTGLNTTDKTNIVAAINEVLAGIGEGGAGTYELSSPATRQEGGINIGDVLRGQALDELLEKMLAPYTAPTLSNTALTGQHPYNEQNAVKSVTFRWVQNTGTPALVSYQIQYRRTGETDWNNLATAINHVNATTEDASANITVNTGGVNNLGVEFRCLWQDASILQTTPTVTSGFADYVASSKSNPSVGATTRERGDKNSTLQSTIIRQSPNVPFGTYQWQRNVNGVGWGDISGASGAITQANQIVSYSDFGTDVNADSVQYRVGITENGSTTYSNATQITFNYPYWYSVTAEDGTDISDADIVALSTTAPNVKELKGNNSRTKSLSNFGGGTTRIIYVGPDTAGVPVWTVNGLGNTAFTTRRSNSAFTNSFGATWNIIVVVSDNVYNSSLSSVIIS